MFNTTDITARHAEFGDRNRTGRGSLAWPYPIADDDAYRVPRSLLVWMSYFNAASVGWV